MIYPPDYMINRVKLRAYLILIARAWDAGDNRGNPFASGTYYYCLFVDIEDGGGGRGALYPAHAV